MTWNGTSQSTCNERLLVLECEAITTTEDWPTFWRRHRQEVRAICEAEGRSFSQAHDGLLRAWRQVEPT